MSQDEEGKKRGRSKDVVDPDFVDRLARILSDNALTEIEIEHDDVRIKVARKHPPIAASVAVPSMPAPAAPPSQSAPAAPVAQAEPAPADPSKNAVPSPMVGTAYLSPEPGAPAFLKVGDSVREGQTILIIEAMKTMNAIPAPRAGKVTAIMVEDAQPVEYGEPLLVIE